MPKQTQNALLGEAYVAITNTLNNPELQASVGRYGYDEARLREGLAHHSAVKQRTQQREQATQTARETAALYEEAKKQLLELFQMHREIARLAFKWEDKYTDHLKLTRRMQRATVDMLAQAETFYGNVPVPMMEKHRVSRKELNEAATLVTQVQDLQAMRDHTQSQVQSLTQARLQALEAMQTWMRRFITVAKVALEEQPQQLEALNQTVVA